MSASHFVSLFLLCSTVSASLGQATSPTAQPVQGGSPVSSLKGFVLEDGTPVKLRLSRNVSSADAHVGDTVDFDVLEEVGVNGVTVIPKGSLALGTVTEAQPKRRMARGGKLDMNIDSVRLADGEKAALRALKESKGGGHTGAMTVGIVATGLLVWPAAPFFLFMHGKDITVPKGAEITAYINGDMKLGLTRFQPTPQASAAPAMSSQPSGSQSGAGNSGGNSTSFPTAKLSVTSIPDGADIEIDGSFVGNTPSDVEVSPGDHTISVKKPGFKEWERKLKVSSGSSVHLNAELEKVAVQ